MSVFDCPHTETGEQTYLDELKAWLVRLPRPCALFAVNDLIGRQVLAMAKSAGIDVPRELTVVAVDNDARICEHTVPTLSSVQQGRTLLAEIQRVQIEAVRQALRQQPAMKQYALADACGFASPEDLRRVFKKVTGQTIGAWLKAQP